MSTFPLLFLCLCLLIGEGRSGYQGGRHGSNSPGGLGRSQTSWRNTAAQTSNFGDEESGGGYNKPGTEDGLLDEDYGAIQQSQAEDFSGAFGGSKGSDKLSNEIPQVRTPKGTFAGKYVTSGNGKRVALFAGIPYAKPPVGDLRFKKPVPYPRATTTYQATELPNTCIQESFNLFGGFSGEAMWNPNTNVSEDCLYLNIWIPESVFEKKDSELVSVLFWIYGGGFFSGSGTIDMYNGGTLASEEDVIVVTSQYRLGPLGFLYLGTEEAPGNMGLWDQNLALQWVHDNIHGFGGDPKSVTLFGESAGSASVGYHHLSAASKPLFKRGVMMSGLPGEFYSFVPPNLLTDRSKKLAEVAGCDPNACEVVSCLRNVDPKVLSGLQWQFYKQMLQFPFGPTLDASFLTDTPVNLIKNGEGKRSDLLIGTVQDEGSFFVIYQYMKLFHLDKATDLNRDRFVQLMREIFQNLNPQQQDAVITYYTNWENVEDGVENAKRLVDAVGDAVFVCPNRLFADAWSNRGLKTFYYHFTERYVGNPWGDWMGVMHGDELPFFLGLAHNSSHQPPFTGPEKRLSSLMMRLLANFAKIGIPSDRWERYSSEAPIYLNLNSTVMSDATSSETHGPRANHCAFWNKIVRNIEDKGGRRRGQEPDVQDHEDEVEESVPESCPRHRHSRPSMTRTRGNKNVSGGVHGGRGFTDHTPSSTKQCTSQSGGRLDGGQSKIPLGAPKGFGYNPQQVTPIPV